MFQACPKCRWEICECPTETAEIPEPITITRGHFVGLIWTGGDFAIRWQIHIPTGTPGEPDGKIVAGGMFGTIAPSLESATEAIETHLATL